MKFLILILFIPFTLMAKCPDFAPPLKARFAVTSQKDIPYCGNLVLDVYRPTTKGNYPLVIFLHGGAWVAGSKNGFNEQLTSIASKGFVGVGMNYRLAGRDAQGNIINKFPAQTNDIRCAVNFLKNNGKNFNIDTSKIGIIGESAGAHLAILAGLDPVNSIRAIANLYGPVNLPTLYQDSPNLRDAMVTTFGENMGAPEWFNGSSVNFISNVTPPILTVHGSLDLSIPVNQAYELKEASAKAGSVNELYICEGEGHGLTPSTRSAAFEYSFNFFAKNLK